MDQLESSERLGGGGTSSPPARKKAVGVTPIKRKTKAVYQIAFSFQGVECREVVDLPHSKANETYCARLRAEILGKIARGTFDYTEHFPESKRAAVFGGAAPASTHTMKKRLEAYRDRVRSTLELSTFKCYSRDIDNILVPWLGDKDVRSVTRAEIREWVGLQSVGLKRVQNILLPLRNVLNEAVDDGVIEASPLAGLDVGRLLPPAQRTSDYEPRPYSVAELVTLLNRLDGIKRWTFQLWAFTGLRTSELVGLRWANVDLAAATLHVCEVTTVGQDKPRPKTPAGVRTIPLLPAALQAARELHAITGPAGRVTVNPGARREDGFWRDNQLGDIWERAHRGTGIEPRNPYQLRHSWASQMLSQGENIAHIARLMGHRDIEMVMRTYGKWVSEGERLGEDRPPRRFGMEELPVQ
jgi:integrase